MFYTCNTTAGIYDSRQLSINADMLFGEPVNISTLFLSRAHLIVRAQLWFTFRIFTFEPEITALQWNQHQEESCDLLSEFLPLSQR